MVSIKPVDFSKGYASQSKLFEKKGCKKKDQKILTLVLQKMDLLEEEGSGLLASACAPQVVLQKVFDKKQRFKYPTTQKKYPMGIYSNEKAHWLNACLQLILFIPSLLQWTYFLPKRFDSLKDFIETYRQNLGKQKAVESIPPNLISQFNVDAADPIFSFFYLLKKSIPPPLTIPFFLEVPKQANEFFIYLTKTSQNPHLFYTFEDQFYELTAFIEKRKKEEVYLAYLKIEGKWIQCDDHRARPFSVYLAYLKIEGKWIQCDDHRARPFSARNLKIALAEAAFCYYKRVQLPFQKILK